MRIVIDMQGAQTASRFRGIGRYSLSLAQAIARNRGEHEVILALNGLFPDTIEPIRASFDGLLPQSNIRVWYALAPVRQCEDGNASNSEAAELVRESFLKSLKPDIIHISSFFEGFVDDAVASIGAFDQTTPTVVTLYDLIPLINPEQYLQPNPAYEQYYLKKIESLKQATAWLGISDFTSKDGCRVLGMREDHVFNISSACDPKFKRIEISSAVETELRQLYGISRPFVLYTGGGDTRKNLHRLVSAYAQLSGVQRQEYQLVLAGQLSDEETRAIDRVAQLVDLENNELVFTGYVSDADLIKLYSLCALFVFPSWYEGFGLPVLEAMACGAPAIAANASSLPEVLDWKDALFDPYSVSSIATKISQALTDNVFRERLISHGIEQAKKFTWDESARKAIAAFEQVHKDCQSSVHAANLPTRRIKLAYISPLPLERSGIADYSAELLPALSRFYDIEVIVAQSTVSDDWITSHCAIRSVEWFEQHAGSYDRLLYHFGNSPFHQHMFDLLQRFPGVVVLHDFFLSSVQAYRESQGIAPNIWALELYHAHGYAAARKRFQTSDIKDVIAKYPCSFSVLQRAEGVIVHSTHSVELARKWYGNEVVSNWNVIPLLRQPAVKYDQSRARQNFKFAANDFIICSFGLLDPAKQNHRLLEAWLKSELAKNEHCQLIFVGQNHGGNYGEQLQAAILQSGLKQRIRITGWVDTDTFRDYLAVTDIAVQLRTMSRGETSAAVLDCMNYGLPTIVNANGAMADLPPNAVYMLPDEFEDGQLVEALEMLWRDCNLRQSLSDLGRNTVVENHSPAVCAEQYATVIESFTKSAQTNRQALINKLARLESLSASDGVRMKLSAAIAQNQPDKRAARNLFIDVSSTCRDDLRTGIERVARALVSELIQSPPDGYRIEPVFLTDEGGFWHYRHARKWTLSTLGCPNEWIVDDIAEFQPQDLLLIADLTGGRLVEAVRARVYQNLRDIDVSLYFMIYDLLPITMPDVFPPGASEQHAVWLAAVNRVADGVVCISQSVKNEYLEVTKAQLSSRLRPIRASWFHLGADIESTAPTQGLPTNAAQILNLLAARPSFLMVGTIEPRKGYLQTLEAFTQLWLNGLDINLVIVGKEGWKGLPDDMRRTIPTIVKRLRNHPELNKRLFWLDGISDEYLEKVYAASTCLIAASEGEGFGLPLIESAQHKKPIIARDIPVFREVADNHAYYFKGLQHDSLALAIQNWLELYQQGKAPSSETMTWLSWQQSAQSLLQHILPPQNTLSCKKKA